jgi:hypothetical protein
MSRHDGNHFIGPFVQEEMADTLAKTVTHLIPKLSPITRLRLLAFMHLLENPETMKADLDVEPSGCLRLTLAIAGAPDKSQQH